MWETRPAVEPERAPVVAEPEAPPPPRFGYLPFGVGPRVCIGAQFAQIEAVIVLAKLARAFRIAIPAGRRVMPMGVITVYPDRAPAFEVRPRAG